MSLPGRNSSQQIAAYIIVPLLFLTVALLGGLRIGQQNGEFIFLRPGLMLLILAVMLVALYARGGMFSFSALFTYANSRLANGANALTLLALFAASVQMLNCVIPEKGLSYLIVMLFFVWTLWNNLFLEFTAQKLLRSLAALFGLAFILKYVVLANLASGESSWAQKLLETAIEGVTFGMFEIPRYHAATGYVAFFALALYVAGLFLFSSVNARPDENSSPSAVSDITS
jgi:uncharacterized membrane protein YGL010W